MGIIAYRAKKKVSEFQNDVKSRMQSVQDEQNRSLTSRSPGLEPEARIQTTAPKPGWKSYVNAKENLPSALQSNFVAFSFDYPKSFELQPQSDVNFVKVEKYAAAGKGNTAENFAVGYAWHGLTLKTKDKRGNNKDYVYYCCGGRQQKDDEGRPRCRMRGVRAAPLEQAVWDDVCVLLKER